MRILSTHKIYMGHFFKKIFVGFCFLKVRFHMLFLSKHASYQDTSLPLKTINELSLSEFWNTIYLSYVVCVLISMLKILMLIFSRLFCGVLFLKVTLYIFLLLYMYVIFPIYIPIVIVLFILFLCFILIYFITSKNLNVEF